MHGSIPKIDLKMESVVKCMSIHDIGLSSLECAGVADKQKTESCQVGP
jgi:hypothetical protein